MTTTTLLLAACATVPRPVSNELASLAAPGPHRAAQYDVGCIAHPRIGGPGHSLGAYAGLAVGGMRVPLDDQAAVSFRDDRVRAAVPMSMSENIPRSGYAGVEIPMLHFTGTHDSSLFYGTTPRARRVPFESIRRHDQYLVTISGANHSTFSDDENEGNRAAHDVIRAATVLFWNAYLRDDAGALDVLRNGALARPVNGEAKVWV